MKRRLELQPDMKNVLELKRPKSYRCRVVGYVLERALMVVEISHARKKFYVVFPDVHYYDGSFLWQGASLRIASRDEQFEYMLEKSIVAALGLLFIFEGIDSTVNLLGGEWIGIFDDLPARFK